jgi:hypothetical protein
MARVREEAVYVCNWEQKPGGFSVWVKGRPKFRAEASTCDGACDRLVEKIQGAADGTATPSLEFDPPLPISDVERPFTEPELYWICGDDRFLTDRPMPDRRDWAEATEARLKWSDDFFLSPACRNCWTATSPRNERILSLEYAPPLDGGFGSIGGISGTMIQLLAEEFLDLLTPEEKGRLDLRPVTRKRGRRKFYELIGPAGQPFVAVSGLPAKGSHCEECGNRKWGYYIEGMTMSEFVAKSDLPKPLPGLFTIGSPPEIKLVATAERWQQLVGRRGTRGFKSHSLGVVPDRLVVRSPELPKRGPPQDWRASFLRDAWAKYGKGKMPS